MATHHRQLDSAAEIRISSENHTVVLIAFGDQPKEMFRLPAVTPPDLAERVSTALPRLPILVVRLPCLFRGD